jgi:hypothetical protein
MAAKKESGVASRRPEFSEVSQRGTTIAAPAARSLPLGLRINLSLLLRCLNRS